MRRYEYPAIFKPEDDHGYSVFFPDLESCYTCGDDLQEAVFMAGDVLAFVLSDYEEESREIPRPSKAEEIKVQAGEFVHFIMCDMDEYNNMCGSQMVGKFVKIPQNLSNAAFDQEIDLSEILQEALRQKLSIR